MYVIQQFGKSVGLGPHIALSPEMAADQRQAPGGRQGGAANAATEGGGGVTEMEAASVTGSRRVGSQRGDKGASGACTPVFCLLSSRTGGGRLF